MLRKSGKRKQSPVLPKSTATDDGQAAGSPTDPISLLVRLFTDTKRSGNVKADDHDATVFMSKDWISMLKLLEEAGEESHLSSVELPSLVVLLEQTELDQLLEINVVVSILLQCEEHDLQRRCIYLIAKNFFGLSEGSQQGKKNDITEALMHKLLSILIGDDTLSSPDDNHFLLRRVIAILLLSVVTASAVNRQLLIDQSPNILQRIGAIASSHEDLILSILAGRLINSMLEIDTSFCLEDLWPLSQESNILEKFPAPGLPSLEWNNQFQRFVRGNKPSSVTHFRHFWWARAVASVPESYLVRQRSICLYIRAGVLSIWAQPVQGEFEDVLDILLTVIDTVDIVESLLDSKGTLHASLNLQLNLKATGFGDNCFLNYASTTLSSIRIIPESASELSTMSDTLRSFLPKYKGRVLTCISPIRNSWQSSNSLDDKASLSHENSKQSPDAFDPQVRAESPTPCPRNRRPQKKIIPTTGVARQAGTAHDSPENIQSEKNKTKKLVNSPPQVSDMKRTVASTYGKNKTRLPKSTLTAKPALKLTRLTESKVATQISSNLRKDMESTVADEAYVLDELQERSALKLSKHPIDSIASNLPPTNPAQTNNALPERPSIPQKALTNIKPKHPPKPRPKKLEKHKPDTNNKTLSEQAPLRKSARNAAKVANTKILQAAVVDMESSIREETLLAFVKSPSTAKRDGLFPQSQWKKSMAKEDQQVVPSPLKPNAMSKVDFDNSDQGACHEKVSHGWDVPELVTSDNEPSMLSPIAYDGEDKNDSIKSTMAAKLMHLLPPSQKVEQAPERAEQDTSTLSEIDHELSKFFGPATLNEKSISTGEHVERSNSEEQVGLAPLPRSSPLDEMVDDVDTFYHILADTQAVHVFPQRENSPVIDRVQNNEIEPDTPEVDVMQYHYGGGTTNANTFPVPKVISPCPDQTIDLSRRLEHLERLMQAVETHEPVSQPDDVSDQNISLLQSTPKKGLKSSLELQSKIAATTPAPDDIVVEKGSTIANNDRDSTAKVFQNEHELHRSHEDDSKQNVLIDESPDIVTPNTAHRSKSPQSALARPTASENIITLRFVASFTPCKPALQRSEIMVNTCTASSIEPQSSPQTPIIEARSMELKPNHSKQNNSSVTQRDRRLTGMANSTQITEDENPLPVSRISDIDSLIQRDQNKSLESPIHVELHHNMIVAQNEVASTTMKLPSSPTDEPRITESFAQNSASAQTNKVGSFTAARGLPDTLARGTTKPRTFMVVNSKSKPVHVLSDTERVEVNKYRPHRQTEDGAYVDIQTRKISVTGDVSQPLLSDPFGKQVQRATSSRVAPLDSLPSIRKALSGVSSKLVARPRVKIDTGMGNSGEGPPRKRSRPESEDERTLINPPDDSDLGSSDTSSDSDASSIGHSSNADTNHETVLGEKEETIEEIWKRAIQPHHQGVTQSMTLMLNELIRVLVDKETAIRLVVEDYERGASRLVKHIEEQQRVSQSNHEQEFNMSRIIAEDKCKKLKETASDIFESSDTASRERICQEWKKKQDESLKLLQDAKFELRQ